jgi:hypothetical protein
MKQFYEVFLDMIFVILFIYSQTLNFKMFKKCPCNYF